MFPTRGRQQLLRRLRGRNHLQSPNPLQQRYSRRLKTITTERQEQHEQLEQQQQHEHQHVSNNRGIFDMSVDEVSNFLYGIRRLMDYSARAMSSS